LDAVLSRLYRVEVFADDPECILKVGAAPVTLAAPVGLSDGTRFAAGDPIIEIHFWNEHLPRIEERGADLWWGRQFGRRLAHSLHLLAVGPAEDARYRGFVALHGVLGFIPEDDVDLTKRLASRFGFTLELRAAPGLRFWRGAFWGALYSRWLMWAFNPHTLRRKPFRSSALCDLWMTRETLLGRYGGVPSRGPNRGAGPVGAGPVGAGLVESRGGDAVMRPTVRPHNPCFSSGPCAKRPGWTPAALEGALVGRSHRSKAGRARIQEVLDRSRALLGLPDDYRIGIVPASDTGAMEMALWSLLGARGVDALAWESFGQGWVTDITKQLKLSDVRVFAAEYGDLPDLGLVDWTRDVVFTWNGTTSGVRVPDGDWIPSEREGLAICDATSAVFAMDVPIAKLDVVTYSWQKVLGGEGQHGVLILSPRAIERLTTYRPPWPLPKLFRMTKGGEFMEAIFKADTINTPSLLCVEDALDGLRWAEGIGGLPELIRRSEANLAAVTAWVERAGWVDFLARDPRTRSCTSICLSIVDPWFATLPAETRAQAAKGVASLLEDEGVAYDIAPYREAPPGLRLWGGATVERSDLEALFPWLDWAWREVKTA
jgi:phosphoserine aminotransferase